MSTDPTTTATSPWAPPADAAPPVAPARPRAVVGSVLLLAGALGIVAGPWMTWFRLGDLDVDGFGEIAPATDDRSLGTTFVLLGVVLAALAVTTLVARRVLPLALAAALVGVVAGAAALDRYLQLRDDIDALGLDGFGEVGPGLPVIVTGAAVALVGSLAVVMRRRPRP